MEASEELKLRYNGKNAPVDGIFASFFVARHRFPPQLPEIMVLYQATLIFCFLLTLRTCIPIVYREVGDNH